MTTSPLDLLRNDARAAGFPLVGLAGAGPIDEAGRLAAWLAAGHGDRMAWLGARAELRLDPRRWVPGAQTVVVLAVPHGAGEAGTGPEPPPAPGAGRVARFARGADYHKVLERRLKDLRRRLAERWPGELAWSEVDTGPVLERAWAQRAGLGVFGWHAGLITPQFGSWVLLATLLLSRSWPADPPAVGACAGCGQCLARCPTGALLAPGTVDARRCLAYLTIEERGPIPRALRAALGSRLFGCDSCQEGCPHNAVAEALGDPELRPLPGRRDLDLARLLALPDEEALRQWLPGSPLRRPKLAGLKRNAALVLGNQRAEAAAPALLARLRGDPSPVVRGAAAWALGQLGGSGVQRALDVARGRETEPEVRDELAAALEES